MNYTFSTSLGMISHTVARLLGEHFMLRTKKAGLEIMPDEWFLLSLLYHKTSCTQHDLVMSMNLNKVRITRLIEGLEGKNWIERHAASTDRRYKTVTLTATGRAYYLKAKPFAQQTIEQAFEGFSQSDYHLFMSQMSKILENLKTENTTLG